MLIVSTFEANGIVADIASMTLDQVFSVHEIRRCKLLKIDCEGMEYEILFGARVLDRVEYLAGEFHASASLQSQGWCPERLRAYCSSYLEDNKMTIEFKRYRNSSALQQPQPKGGDAIPGLLGCPFPSIAHDPFAPLGVLYRPSNGVDCREAILWRRRIARQQDTARSHRGLQSGQVRGVWIKRPPSGLQVH